MKKNISSVLFGLIALTNTALAECTVNGQVVPCDQVPKWPFAVIAVIAVLMMIGMVFWFMMLIDLVKNEKDNDLVVWLLVLLFFGILGAIVYYFARKKGRNGKK
jgi:hypothetical protein